MNHIYKLVWCMSKNGWVAVSELTKSHQRNSSKKCKLVTLSFLLGLSQTGYAANDKLINNSDITSIGDNTSAFFDGGIPNVTYSGIDLLNTGILHTKGKNSHGIHMYRSPDRHTIELINTGNITTEGDHSHGILYGGYFKLSMAKVHLKSSANQITTLGENSVGIAMQLKGASPYGDTFILENESNISTYGKLKGSTLPNTTGLPSSGILIYLINNRWGGDGEEFIINNSGSIQTKGIGAHAIQAYTLAATVGTLNFTVNNTSMLNTENSTALGIYTPGNIAITNTGDITASNIAASNKDDEVSAHGIAADARKGHININHQAGTIKVKNTIEDQSAHGILAWNAANDYEDLSSSVSVGSKAVIDATEGNSGIFLNTVKDGSVTLAEGATVMGGREAGVTFGIEQGGNSAYSIQNAGTIGSASDHAINVIGSTETSQLDLTNTGTIKGYVTASNQTVLNFENSDEFLVQNQSKDSKNVAISHFNGGTFDNKGTTTLASAEGLKANTSGEYVPSSALSSQEANIVHGHFMGVKNFNHQGLLDLTGSGTAGNVFVVSGGQKAGENGGGTFTTNGGVMKVATVLNAGGQDSRSDMLVVDNLKKGSAATAIDVTIAAGSKNEKTVDNGIQIVQTLGSQDKGAFELAGPLTYGSYEYLLYSDDASGTENGYYLRNKLKPVDPVKPVDPTKPKPPTKTLPNPNIGAYLGNQYAAANMFNQNILDRRDNPQAPDQTVWARTQYNMVRTDHMNDTQKLKIENSVVQIGMDLYKNDENGHIAGAFIGYGKSDVGNTSYLTGTKAKGDVKGLQIGAYYSWLPKAEEGPYVDVWGHYADYSSKLKGSAQKNKEKKYDGYGLALSVEGGYSFLVQETDNAKWMMKPHVQLSYDRISQDDFTDHTNTRFSDNKAQGIQTRVGARFYANKKAEQSGILPYAELNWLYNGMSNEVAVNGSKESSKIGKNLAELKLGLQGNINKQNSIFAHFGLQKGADDYERVGGQIGYNYNWK